MVTLNINRSVLEKMIGQIECDLHQAVLANMDDFGFYREIYRNYYDRLDLAFKREFKCQVEFCILPVAQEANLMIEDGNEALLYKLSLI